MSNRLKLSKKTSTQLDFLSSKLALRRNIICRLAIGRSLVIEDSVEVLKNEDSSGYEFNRTTITGNQDMLFRALIIQHEGKKINSFIFFPHYVRNHIERGIGLLFREYQKINSPIEFLLGLIDYDSHKKTHLDLFKK